MLCLFNYRLKYECEVCLYSFHQWKHYGENHVFGVRFAPYCQEEFMLLRIHAYKNSLARKRLWYFPALVEKTTSVSSGPVTTPWPRGSAMFGSRECNRDQGSVTLQNKSETPINMGSLVYDQGFKAACTNGGQWSSEVDIS